MSTLLQDELNAILIGNKLSRARKDAKLTLRQLAERTEEPVSTLSDQERGDASLDINRLERLSKALEKPFSDFFPAIQTEEQRAIADMIDSRWGQIDRLFGLGKDSRRSLLRSVVANPTISRNVVGTIENLLHQFRISNHDIIQALLKAHQQHRGSYFDDTEEEALSFRKDFENQWPLHKPLSRDEVNLLEKLLSDEGYYINSELLGAEPDSRLADVRWIYARDRKAPQLYVNTSLSLPQRAFLYARELYYARNLKGADAPHLPYAEAPPESFGQALDFYHASYFAGAVLIPQPAFEDCFGAFLSQRFDLKSYRDQDDRDRAFKEAFLGCALGATPNTYMVRIGELSHTLGLHDPAVLKAPEFDFIRFDDYRPDPVESNRPRGIRLTRSLNMSSVADIRQVHAHWHYCRRWGVTQLLDQLLFLKENSNLSDGVHLVKAQQARYIEPFNSEEGDSKELFTFSMAYPLSFRRTHRGLSIAFPMNDRFKERVAFWEDFPPSHSVEGAACEICSLASSCQERENIRQYHVGEVDNWKYRENEARVLRRQAIQDFIRKAETQPIVRSAEMK